MMQIFNYNFGVNAFLAILLLGVIAGIIGTYIVVRRSVFIAGGITHASFGGIGITSYIGANPIVGAIIFAILTSLGIELLAQKGKVRHDSAIAILWSFGMAVGLIFIFLTPGYAPNLLGFLFGDILAISRFDLISMTSLVVALTVCVSIFYRPIMYILFDAQFSKIVGWRVNLVNMITSVVVSLAIVLSIKAVGIVLALSIFTIPQAIATIWARSLKHMMIVSSVIAVIAGLLGLFVCFTYDLPLGPIITAILAIIFAFVKLFKLILSNKIEGYARKN